MNDAATSIAEEIENRWKSYPVYKDSGVEWLGEIPEGWEISKLGAIASVKARLGWKGLKASEYVDEGYIFLSTPNIKPREIDFKDVNYITAERYFESPEIMLEEGDVLIAKDGSTLGITNVVRFLSANSTVNSSIAVIRPRGDFDSVYLYYFFLSHFTQSMIQRMKDGMGVPHLFQADLRKFVVLNPPLLQQRTIASFLDRETAYIDTLIAKKERLIELLTEERSALISHVVTKGLEPTVPMKNSGLEWIGEIPAHWIPKKIKYLFRQTKRQNYADLTVLSVYRDYGVIEKDSRDDNHNRTPENLDMYQLVNVGDLVINKMKAWQGSLGMSEYQGITSPDYVVYAPEHGEDSRFLHYLLRAQAMADVYRSISNGIRPSQWRLEPENFEKLVVFLPPLSEQAQICKFIDVEYRRLEHLITQAQKLISYLNEYRTALISAAVTGKIDVREEGT